MLKSKGGNLEGDCSLGDINPDGGVAVKWAFIFTYATSDTAIPQHMG
jgi:hypothetical protein